MIRFQVSYGRLPVPHIQDAESSLQNLAENGHQFLSKTDSSSC